MRTVPAQASEPATGLAPNLADRCRWAVPFVLIGTTAIVAGGLVAAITRPTDFDLGPWVAAFLVLVAGVAQIALGAGQGWLADDLPSTAKVRVEIIAWNLGAGATLLGSILEIPALTTGAGVVTVTALIWFAAPVWASTTGPRWARSLYLVGVAVLLVSTPIGVLLAWR